MQTATFIQRLSGRFDGMIRLEDVARLEERMASADGWFLVEPGRPLPECPVDGAHAREHLRVLVEEILTVEQGVWTTMVFAQSMEDPEVVKVYHPRRAGCGCGGGTDVKPWWVLSRVIPEPVPGWPSANMETCASGSGGTQPQEGLSWWNRLF